MNARDVLEVVVQPHRQRVVVVASDADFARKRVSVTRIRFDQEIVHRIGLIDKHKAGIHIPEDTMCQPVDGALGRCAKNGH